MWQYPNIDPVIFQIGPIALRWYSLAYIVGLVAGFGLLKQAFQRRYSLTMDDITNLMTATMIGIILGGRLGYILFYNAPYYLQHPLETLALWHGGMSFHGGALGAGIAVAIVARQNKHSILGYLDLLALGSTIGLFLGRIANFINGELYGRITSHPIGMVFPGGGPFPRHPSQLYEALGEGLLLGLILWLVHRYTKHKPGLLLSLFLALYGAFRFIIEFFREPDGQIDLIIGTVSMGQFLCLITSLVGILLASFIVSEAAKKR